MCFHSVSDWVESTLVFLQDVAMFVFFLSINNVVMTFYKMV